MGRRPAEYGGLNFLGGLIYDGKVLLYNRITQFTLLIKEESRSNNLDCWTLLQ